MKINLFLLIYIFFITPTHSEVVVDWDIKKLEFQLKNDIETGLREYLGANKKFKVYIQINGKKKFEEKKEPNFNESDFAYLSLADSYQDVKVSEKIVVNSISTDIFIYGKINRAVEKNIRKISSGALKGHKSKITLTVMDSLPLDSGDNDSSMFPLNLKKIIIDHLSDIIKFISNLIMAGLGLIGVYLLGRALIAAFRSISDAIKNPEKQLNKEEGASEDNEGSIKEESSQKIEEVFNNQLEMQLERSLEIVKSCLRSSPHIFKGVLIRKEENLQGLKNLLPLLVEFTLKLKELISPEIWKSVESKESLGESTFHKWINQFAEDISIAQMSDNGYFSFAIDYELLEKLHFARPSHLVEAAFKVNSSILYKFIIDFVPYEDSLPLFKAFDEETWRKTLSERKIDTGHLNNDISLMLQIVDTLVDREKKEINDEAITKIFSGPVSLFLKSKTFEEVDDLFIVLEESAPDLVKALRDIFWTPQMLFRVPLDYLREQFNILSVEARVQILLCIQDNLRDHLMALVPPGKVTTIVTDQYNRDLGSFDEKEKTRSIKKVKEFLESLRKDSKNGRFHLLDKEDDSLIREEVIVDEVKIEDLEEKDKAA